MSGVIVGMETNEVAVQDAHQNVVSHRKNAIDFTRWERCVQEEANLDIFLWVFCTF